MLAELCREFGSDALTLLGKLKQNDSSFDAEREETSVGEKLDKITHILGQLLPKVHDINKEELGDMIDQEMHNTSEAIEAAVAKLQALITNTREKDTGMKLEVNDKILDSCTELMKAIKLLIMRAKELQKEIVAQGRVSLAHDLRSFRPRLVANSNLTCKL